MRTPSQTVGPFFSFALCTRPQHALPEGTVPLVGSVVDGAAAPIHDALLELWDPRAGFGRCPTDEHGRYSFLLPSGVARFELMVFARGLLKPALTRVYLDGADAEDATMVATAVDGGFRFDVRLQGDDATAFFEL